jgi:hypothetical protein
MSDGHSGIENRQVNQGGSGNFKLILAYLKQADGRGEFVIHATSNISYSYGLQPLEFLASIGFTQFRGQCPFHQDKCFYRVIGTLQREVSGFENFNQVHMIHNAFKEFAGKVGELFTLRQNEDRILREMDIKVSGQTIFNSPVNIEITESEVPLWVEEVKFPRLRELEKQTAILQNEITSLNLFLPLLYSTGDTLEKAVIDSVRLFGLDAKKTSRGFTVDVLAQTSDGLCKFGFEITGLNGSIKKDSNKLTQVLDFERVKEHEEKTVLLANTHNTTPITKRTDLEDFTQPVLDFLGKHPILLMTSWNLYCMVRDVLANTHTKDDIVKLLYETNGRLVYR